MQSSSRMIRGPTLPRRGRVLKEKLWEQQPKKLQITKVAIITIADPGIIPLKERSKEQTKSRTLVKDKK